MNRSNRVASRASFTSGGRRLARAVVEGVEARRLLASVGGVVFGDANGDGVRQPVEGGLNFEVVYADRNNNGIYDGNDVATRTNVNGQYKLENLPADGATFTVRVRGEIGSRVVSPAGNGYSIKFASVTSSETGRDFAIRTTTAGTVTVSGRAYLDNDFSGSYTTGDTTNAGTVFADYNFNGVLDAGEPSTTRNASTGEYALTGVAANRSVNVAALDVGGRTAYGSTSTPAAGGTVAHVDMRNNPNAIAVNLAPFADANGDGVHQSSEQPQKVLDLWIDANANGLHDAGEQSPTRYETTYFAYLPQGSGTSDFTGRVAYRLVGDVDAKADGFQIVTYPASAPRSPTPTTYIAVKPATTQSAVISGRVTNDANRNGIHDAGEEGLSFEVVYLDRNKNGAYDAGDLATRTDASGYYSFAAQLLDGSAIAVRLRGIESPRKVTAPSGGAYQVTLNAASKKTGLDFGVSPK